MTIDMHKSGEVSSSRNRLGFLDGLRGLAALWVLVSHMGGSVGFTPPVLTDGTYAVDLFMIISGFLMYYHAVLREPREPIAKFSSHVYFWTRRFFRIAPLYYAVLIAAFLLGPFLLAYNQNLLGHALPPENFTDDSWANILLHVSFIFGAWPEYHYRTLLPDWSISLEMQFYLIFPLLFLAMARFNPLIVTASIVVGALAAWATAPAYFAAFMLPSFLPMKITMFLAGMLICAAMTCAKDKFWLYVVTAIVIAGIPTGYAFGVPSTVIRIIIVIGFAMLALHERMTLPATLKNFIARTSNVLGNRLFFWMGELSYGVYLAHMFFVIFIGSAIIKPVGSEWSAPLRFALDAAICIPLVYMTAWILHVLVEKPGIAWGKTAIEKLKARF